MFTRMITTFYILRIWTYNAYVWKSLRVSFPAQLESHQSEFYRGCYDEIFRVASDKTKSMAANFDISIADFLWKRWNSHKKKCKIGDYRFWSRTTDFTRNLSFCGILFPFGFQHVHNYIRVFPLVFWELIFIILRTLV